MNGVTLRAVLAAMALLGLASCDIGGREPDAALLDTCRDMFSSCKGETGELLLRACLLADDYSTRGPLPVAVAVCNPSKRAVDTARVELDFWFGSGLGAIVVDPHGDTLVSQLEVLVDPTAGHVLGLHGGEFIGRVVDLRCVLPMPTGGCIGQYDFDEPGEYSVTFRLDAFCNAGGCEGREIEPNVLVAPALTIRVVPN